MNRNDITEKIKKLDHDFWTAHEKLVKELRETYVIPFLKANNLCLSTGMGSCTVGTSDGHILFYQKDDREFYPKPSTDEEWEVLNTRFKAIQALPGWDDLWFVLDSKSSLEDPRLSLGTAMDSYEGEGT